MKVNGSYTFNAPKAQVWTLIHDPTTLMQVIPGCQYVEQVSPTEYRGQIHMKLPAIVGEYRTYIKLVQFSEPNDCHFAGEVEGAPGAVRGTAAFRLSEAEGQTIIQYEGQGLITGPLARLNDRFISGLIKTLIDQGLSRLRKQLESELEDWKAG